MEIEGGVEFWPSNSMISFLRTTLRSSWSLDPGFF